MCLCPPHLATVLVFCVLSAFSELVDFVLGLQAGAINLSQQQMVRQRGKRGSTCVAVPQDSYTPDPPISAPVISVSPPQPSNTVNQLQGPLIITVPAPVSSFGLFPQSSVVYPVVPPAIYTYMELELFCKCAVSRTCCEMIQVPCCTRAMSLHHIPITTRGWPSCTAS